MAKRVLSESEARAWDAHVQMSRRVSSLIGRDLARGTDLSVAEHDVLCSLAGAEGRSLRLGALSEAMQWEASRLSHQLRRMERRGLVERHPCVDDGRGVEYALTAAGASAIREAGPAHDHAVRRHLTSALTDAELTVLADLSEKVLATLPEPS